ncbi:unnamed protein product [Rotaria sp. Silwood1]|nr:unnamed protein product [Rotaria sp. Silwood1]
MEGYCKVEKKNISNITSYSKKWTSKIQQQPLLSSYNTTKDVQLEVIRTPERHVELIKARVESIQEIIATYRTEMQRIYPRGRLSISRKHYQVDAMRNLFKDAYSLVSNASSKLLDLREEETLMLNNLRDADFQYEHKVANAQENRTKLQEKLKSIREKIARAEKECSRQQEIYRKSAIDIYQRCRRLEKERLDLIRKTLIKFIKTAFSFENVSAQSQIYEALSSMLQNQQNTSEDLDFWARNYGVYDSTTSRSFVMNPTNDDHNERNSNETTSQKPKNSKKCETVDRTTTDIYVNELRIEHDEVEDDN